MEKVSGGLETTLEKVAQEDAETALYTVGGVGSVRVGRLFFCSLGGDSLSAQRNVYSRPVTHEPLFFATTAK